MVRDKLLLRSALMLVRSERLVRRNRHSQAMVLGRILSLIRRKYIIVFYIRSTARVRGDLRKALSEPLTTIQHLSYWRFDAIILCDLLGPLENKLKYTPYVHYMKAALNETAERHFLAIVSSSLLKGGWVTGLTWIINHGALLIDGYSFSE